VVDGLRYERRLKEKLEKKGFLVIRSAGSFAMDLLAVKDGKCFVYEVKSTKQDVFYLDKKTKQQVEDLLKMRKFGVIPYLAVYFKRKDWKLIKLNDIPRRVIKN